MGSRGRAGEQRSSRGGEMGTATLPLLALLVPTLLGESPGCQFLCGDGFTWLASHQACDNSYDCPSHPAGEGGEDEEVCSNVDKNEEEKEENNLETGGALGLRTDISNLCLDSQAQLVADPNDCHTFYHCDELTPQKQSCGDLMFNTIRMTCDWPRSVMQIRPECRDPDSFKFRLGPRSWDSRRTHRMLNWLGSGRAIARVRVPRPQMRHQQYPRYQQPPPVFRPHSVQVVDQQRRRLVEGRPRVVMPPRLAVPETPMVYASVAPEAPRPHVVRLEQRRRVQPIVRVEQAPVVRVEQAPVRVHSTPRFQPSSLEVKPSAEDLTFL